MALITEFQLSSLMPFFCAKIETFLSTVRLKLVPTVNFSSQWGKKQRVSPVKGK